MVNGENTNPGIIRKIADGSDMTLNDFFDTDVFVHGNRSFDNRKQLKAADLTTGGF